MKMNWWEAILAAAVAIHAHMKIGRRRPLIVADERKAFCSLMERASKRGMGLTSLLAVEEYEAAIDRDPDNANAHANLGSWLLWVGQYAKALDHLDAALRLDPHRLMALCERADLRATCTEPAFRDGAAAVRDATKAWAIAQDRGDLVTEWKHLKHARILAAAYAESGDFDSAISILRKAFTVAVTRTGRRHIVALLSKFEAREPLRTERGIPVERSHVHAGENRSDGPTVRP